MSIEVHRCDGPDLRWIALRARVWPHLSVEEHRDELALHLARDRRLVGFVALEQGQPRAFAEASVRRDYVNGCDTFNVAFLEFIWVHADHRRRGIARALIQAAQGWAQSIGCTEFASDAPVENSVSHTLHRALGFEETERVVFFRKILG